MILSSTKDVTTWDTAGFEVQRLLQLNYCPRVIVLTRRRAMLYVKKEEDKDLILGLQQLLLEGVRINLTKWTPGADTLSSSWFKPKPRWVTFIGIPCQLLTFEIMESLCNCFGTVRDCKSLTITRQLLGSKSPCE